jgi:hypothetical protein
MNKTDNPYKGLVALGKLLARGAAMQPTMGIGIIVSPPPEIKIKYNGFTLDKQFLYIDEYWIQGHTRTHNGHIVSETQPRAGGSGDAEFESHTHDIDNDYTDVETLTDTWKVGDRVLMAPIVGEDGRTTKQFAVLCKLVRLDGN